jgi:hypothetical protein
MTIEEEVAAVLRSGSPVSLVYADQLMADMQSLMLASTVFVVVAIDISGAERYEPDTKRYRASKEFTIRFD